MPSLVRRLWKKRVSLKLGCPQASPGDSVRVQSLIQQVWGWGLRVPISHKLPAGAVAAGAWATPGAERNKRTFPCSSHQCSPVGLNLDFILESPGSFKIN